MTRPCPNGHQCRWDTHPESASWRLCGTCGVERVGVEVPTAPIQPTCGPNGSEVAPRAQGPQIGDEG